MSSGWHKMCDCDAWTMIDLEWAAQPDGLPDIVTCAECQQSVLVPENGKKVLIEHKILMVAMEHPAFKGMGHAVGINQCAEVADRCAGDFRWNNICAVMDGMVGSTRDS